MAKIDKKINHHIHRSDLFICIFFNIIHHYEMLTDRRSQSPAARA